MNKVSVVVSELLRLLGVPATKTTVKDTLRSHPHYPSLLAVRDTLFSLKVPNKAYHLESQHLLELPTPCIVHLKEGLKEEFTIVRSIDQGKVITLKDNQFWHSESTEEFEKRWSGVTMLVEPNESSGEFDFRIARIKELINHMKKPLANVFIIGTVIGILLYHLQLNAPIEWWWLFLLKTIGLLVSLLLMTEFSDGYKYIKQVCGLSSQVDCTKILKSNESTLFGIVSWSELAFVYFTGGFLWIGFTSQYSTIMKLIFCLNLLTLPFTIYSVYYQFHKIKKICTLCLIIVLVLWLEALVFIITDERFHFSAFSIYIGGISFLFPITLWIVAKPWIVGSQETKRQFHETQKIKTDPKIFSNILQSQQVMPGLNGLQTIKLGNPDAPNTITVITNPLCNPCKELHKEITSFINTSLDAKFQIIFAVGDNPNLEKHILAQYFMNAYNEGDISNKLMEEWYKGDKLSFTKWNEKNKNCTGTSIEVIDTLNEHQEWCKNAKVSATPTVFINGYKMPKNYHLRELKFILSSL